MSHNEDENPIQPSKSLASRLLGGRSSFQVEQKSYQALDQTDQPERRKSDYQRVRTRPPVKFCEENHFGSRTLDGEEDHTLHGYFLSLAAKIMCIESVSSEDSNCENKMDHPFDYHNDERITEEQFDAANNHSLWVTMPDSIVSLNLTISLIRGLQEDHKDFFKLFALCGMLPILACLFIELSIVTNLDGDFNYETVDHSGFCEQPINLQFAVIGTFFISLMKPLYDILTEIIVGLSTQSAVFDSHALQDLFIHAAGTKATRGRKFEPIGDHSLIVKEVGLSYLTQWVYWAALLGEVVVFYYTVRVGLYYTLSQQDASSIIQAAVAISFINEIDNMLFDAVASHQLKEVVSTTFYEVKFLPNLGGSSFYLSQYQLVLQVPLIIFMATMLVGYYRWNFCDEILGWHAHDWDLDDWVDHS